MIMISLVCLKIPSVSYNLDMQSTNQPRQYTYLQSTSYPPQLLLSSGVEHSSIHQLIRQNPHISQFPITYRQCTREDIPQINQLFQEWFPMNYTKQLYDLFTTTIKCVVGVVTGVVGEREKQLIVGVVAWKIDQQNENLEKQSLLEYLKPRYKDLYVMSLGVIDEMRGRGVARRLMDFVHEEINKDKGIRSMSLHVLSTNDSAISFYVKLGFEYTKLHRYYYCLENRLYSARYYVKYVNGGRKKVPKWWRRSEPSALKEIQAGMKS